MTAWQDAEVARKFLEDRRGAIPYAADQIRMMLELVRHFRRDPARILDLGCGDGILARALMTQYPGSRAVLVDHSPPMLDRARAAMAELGDRVEIREGELGQPIVSLVPAGSIDVVVSGFAIHHLAHPRKKALYEEVYVLLAPGGLFINIEHVASPTREVEALFENLYIDTLAAGTGRPRPEVETEYHTRPDKADNILLDLETQVGWLREIGFEHADCYFKWLELAVIAGAKP